MLTYKIVEKNENIYTYKYFPHGRDFKVEGGLIEFNMDDKNHTIISLAQLDEMETIPIDQYKEMVGHINLLRKEKNFPLIDIDEYNNEDHIFYKFADLLINEINEQIFNDDIKEKGILL